jgi:hypothetical protein
MVEVVLAVAVAQIELHRELYLQTEFSDLQQPSSQFLRIKTLMTFMGKATPRLEVELFLVQREFIGHSKEKVRVRILEM